MSFFLYYPEHIASDSGGWLGFENIHTFFKWRRELGHVKNIDKDFLSPVTVESEEHKDLVDGFDEDFDKLFDQSIRGRFQ